MGLDKVLKGVISPSGRYKVSKGLIDPFRTWKKLILKTNNVSDLLTTDHV